MSALAAAAAAVALNLSAGLAPNSSWSSPPSLPPQNVLLVVLDDVGVDLIGAYEQHFRSRGRAPNLAAETPAIDSMLCAQGVSFTNAWNSPMCSPSRAQMLTGMHALRTGVGAVLRPVPLGGIANPGLALSHAVLPEILATAPGGYAAAAVGKWHLADVDQLALDLAHPLGAPNGRWFDTYAGSLFNLQRALSSPPSENTFFAWRKLHTAPIVLGTNPCGGAYPCVVDNLAPPVTRYATADTTEDALALMARLPEPWFLHLAYNAAHAPFHDAPANLPKPTCAEYPPPLAACEGAQPPNLALQARCMLRALDEQLGRILCAHDPETTTVILIADNGTDGEASLPPFTQAHAKGSLYQGGVQVPLVVRGPGVRADLRGTFNDRLVCGTDLFATVCEIAGVSAAAPDSVSLVPYLRELGAGPVRTRVYAEGFFPNFTPTSAGAGPPPGYVCGVHNQTVRDERFKLLRRSRRVTSTLIVVEEELYDLTQGGPLDTSTVPSQPTPDWFEQNDLLASGLPLSVEARGAYQRLRDHLAQNFPSLVQ